MRNAKQKEARLKYDQSPKGKLAKKKHDATYTASGGRVAVEQRRSAKPVSAPRLAARKRWAVENKAYFAADMARRRSLNKNLSELDHFALFEAANLARRRSLLMGFEWQVDHITPVSKGGTTTVDNLQVVPADWNRRKSNKHQNRYFGA